MRHATLKSPCFCSCSCSYSCSYLCFCSCFCFCSSTCLFSVFFLSFRRRRSCPSPLNHPCPLSRSLIAVAGAGAFSSYHHHLRHPCRPRLHDVGAGGDADAFSPRLLSPWHLQHLHPPLGLRRAAPSAEAQHQQLGQLPGPPRLAAW